MKGSIAIKILGTALFVTTLADTPAWGGDRGKLEEVVRGFLAAADRQDVSGVAEHVHPDFRVVYTVRDKSGTTVLDGATYKKLLADKKIGGKPRTVKVIGVEREDQLAFVRARSEHEGARFDSRSTLVVEDGRWKMIAEAVVMTMKNKE